MSPEAFHGRCNHRGDVWSFGMVSLELMARGFHNLSFRSPINLEQLKLGIQPIIPSKWQEKFKLMVVACLSIDPHKRSPWPKTIKLLSEL